MTAKKFQLLNYTKKNSRDLFGFPKPQLLVHPFIRAISRVKYKPDIFEYHRECESIDELKKLDLQNISWSECCLQRAQQLLDLNRDRYYLSYSGGIDSTAMVAAIMQVWPKKELERVSILFSKHSIEENPNFFDKYITQFAWRNSIPEISNLLVEKNALMVTGELGDQLFGSDILALATQSYGDEVLAKNYKDYAADIMGQVVVQPELGSELFERFHPIVEECPFPIRTVHDFFWWYNFTQKWQHVKFRFVGMSTWNLKARYGTHILPFYDTLQFQNWSLKNHDLKIEKSWSSYKIAAKKFIFDFTKDPDQMKLMKIQSLEKTFVLSELRIAVTKDYEAVSNLKDLKNYVREDL